MDKAARHLRPSEAAARLGVSAKALRVYERRGLVEPGRTAAGWRVYGPAAMARAAKVVALRALGFGLAAIRPLLEGDTAAVDAALRRQEGLIGGRMATLATALAEVRTLRQAGLPAARRLSARAPVAFDLPWPWGGERFELAEIRAINFIVGSLGSGKTRLAQALADAISGAAFIGLDRIDPVEELIARREAEGATALVIDMVEQGLDAAAQQALIARLRDRPPAACPLFLMTRSTAILDLAAVGADEAILLCPANHSPPTMVAPCPGSPGYEAVATCLAPPHVRARTEGVVAVRPDAA